MPTNTSRGLVDLLLQHSFELKHSRYITALNLFNILFLFQICFLWYLHLGNDAKDIVTWIHFSHLCISQGCMELARFYCGCLRVSCSKDSLNSLGMQLDLGASIV